MKIAILGFDREGRATYDYFAAAGGHELTICDQNPDVSVPAGAASVLGKNYLDNLDRFDLVVRTAGLPPQCIFEANPGLAPDKITTHMNEFFKASPTQHIIGVTGTKGKGTTSTLISEMLKAAGCDVQLGGNIGIPPLTFLNKLSKDSWVILELSSFQLSDLRYSPPIAVCLTVSPEHLDFHGDIEAYYRAKANLFARQTADDTAIYYAANDTSKLIAAAGDGQKIPYLAAPGAVVKNEAVRIEGVELCEVTELKLPGRHNWQNVCAAVTAVWQIEHNAEAIRSVLTSFAGLPFRIEFRGEVGGVRYYNDSFSSAPPATIAALEAIAGPKIMVIGGFDRGLDIDELAETLKKHDHDGDLRKVLLIGAASKRAASAFDDHHFTNYVLCTAKDMPTIVSHATYGAQHGDAVVLSPGFPSFDMFKNFEDRGQQFNEAVAAL